MTPPRSGTPVARVPRAVPAPALPPLRGDACGQWALAYAFSVPFVDVCRRFGVGPMRVDALIAAAAALAGQQPPCIAQPELRAAGPTWWRLYGGEACVALLIQLPTAGGALGHVTVLRGRVEIDPRTAREATFRTLVWDHAAAIFCSPRAG